MTEMTIEDHHQVWLTERLGEHASSSVRQLVYDAVILGDWFYEDSSRWHVTLKRCDTKGAVGDMWELTIWFAVTTGRFTGSRLRHSTVCGDRRTLDATRKVIGGEM